VDVLRVADRPEDTRRKRPVQLDRKLVSVHIRQDVEQVSSVESDGGAVALDLGFDFAFVVANVRGGADGQSDLGILADLKLDDVGRRAGDQAGQSDGRQQLVAIDRGPGREALRQDLLVVGELAVDESADQVDALDVEQDLISARRQDDVDRIVVSDRTRDSSWRDRAGTTTLVSSTGSSTVRVLTAIR
jgi:hypothetical protein